MHLFRIIVPKTELRIASTDVKKAKNISWYPAPPFGHAAYIELWLTPTMDQPPTQARFMNELLGVLSLENGQQIGVTGRSMQIESQDNIMLQQLQENAVKLGMIQDPRTRGWALTLSNQGVYALLEFSLFPD